MITTSVIKTNATDTQVSSTELSVIFLIAKNAIQGAVNNILTVISKVLCTWVTSFVLRVIKLAVLNLFISVLEKLFTFLNT